MVLPAGKQDVGPEGLMPPAPRAASKPPGEGQVCLYAVSLSSLPGAGLACCCHLLDSASCVRAHCAPIRRKQRKASLGIISNLQVGLSASCESCCRA